MVIAGSQSGTETAATETAEEFGKYLLLQRASVGGMAEVFKAVPRTAVGIEQIIAIKRILPSIAEDSDFIQMFIDEARIAGQLSHPNICRIYELGRVGQAHYIAMQFLWGRDLLKIINRFRKAGRRMPPEMAAAIAADACAGLHHAHTKHDINGRHLEIIHRDVSPQNIIVDYSGQVKLIDFGVARAASKSQKTQAGILKGKFGYMSPEMIRGSEIDHRSDVFAMGICLWEALTGERLFMAETDFATLELVRAADVTAPRQIAREVPPELDAIAMRALDPDRESRYQSAEEMGQALNAFMQSHAPRFGARSVAAWMREAFSREIAGERERLKSLGRMLDRQKASTNEQSGVHPGLQAELDDDDETPLPTQVLPDPRAALPDTSSDVDDGTQIFFSADELDEIRSLEQPPTLDELMPAGPGTPVSVSDLVPDPRTDPGLAHPDVTALPEYPAPGSTFGGESMPVAAPRIARGPGGGNQLAPTGSMPPTPSAVEPRLQPPPPGSQPGVYQGKTSHTELQVGHAQQGLPELRHGQERRRGMLLGALFLMALAFGGWALKTRFFPPRGSIEVSAKGAPNARVYVDGVARGNAPLRIDNVTPRIYVVRIEAPGYEPVESNVQVRAGKTKTVNFVIAGSGTPGSSLAAAAAAAKGNRDPAVVAEASDTARDQEPDETSPLLGVPADTAEDAAKPGDQTSPPANAGGRNEGNTGVRDRLAGPEQERDQRRADRRARRRERRSQRIARAAARANATAPQRTPSDTGWGPGTPSLAAAPSPPVTAARPPPPATAPPPSTTPAEVNSNGLQAPGELKVNTMPWSRVFLDGRDTGRNTPVRSLKVSPGTHELGLRTPDGVMHRVVVNVGPGEQVRVIRDLTVMSAAK